MKRIALTIISLVFCAGLSAQSIQEWIMIHDSIVDQSGTNYISFDANGIGINTDTPTTLFDINGNLNVVDTLTVSVFQSDKIGSGVHELNIDGVADIDTLLAPIDTASAMKNYILVADSAKGIMMLIHKDSVGGAGQWDAPVGGNISPSTATSITVDTTFYDANGYIHYNGGELNLFSDGKVFLRSNNGRPDIEVASGGIYMRDASSTPVLKMSAEGLSILNGYGDANAALDINGSIKYGDGTIADNDATPDFGTSEADIWTYAGSANAVTITDIDNPIVGAIYRIIGNSDTYTVTIADGGNFNLSTQWVGGVDDVLIIYVQADNDYIELGRVDN